MRTCPANASTTTTSGCLNRVGALIALRPRLLYGGTGEGLRERSAVDPCQTTNRRPPWFPETRRFTPFRQVNTDPRAVDSATEISALFTSLRGPIVP